MTAIQVIELEIKSRFRTPGSTDYLLRIRMQMRDKGIRKERLELILKSLGYKQIKIGDWIKNYE